MQGEAAISTVGGTAKPISAVAVLACAWPALLLATACLLPFLNKPFLIDDPYFLTMAQQIAKHPAHPTDFTICWNVGPGCIKVSAWFSNTLMGEVAQGYVLVPTVLTGAHEWMAHLTQLVFVWIAIVAMAALVLRFGWGRKHAIAGALLLVAIAPFLPMASTAMPEPLATALALVAMERLAAWKAEQKWTQGTAAAVALGLAGFARPHLVLLFPLAAFFLLESVKPAEVLAQLRQRLWLWTPVLAGCGLVLVIIAVTREHNLAINPPPTVSGLHYNALQNLQSYFLYFVFPFPLAACWVANRLRSGPWHVVIVLAMAAGANWFLQGPLHIVAMRVAPAHAGLLLQLKPLVVFLAVAGFGTLADLIVETWQRRDHTGLFLMLWILIPLPIVYYIQLPAKYLLPCMPAVILLCFRLMEGFPARFTRAAAVGLIVLTTGYSVLILRSDAEFAWFGRNAMYALIQPHVAAGEKVWFGSQFSAYWYAPLAGATLTFPGGPQPKPGDLLVVGLSDGGEKLVLPHFPRRTLVDSVTHKYTFGRTMGAGIGLYTNLLGYWMWGFGDSPDDRYELWRID